MNETTVLKPMIVPENEGTVLNAFDDHLTVKLKSAATGGAFALYLDQVPPGGGPPLHCHDNEDELFIVLEGRIDYFVENRWTELGPGGVVFAPRHQLHAFRNRGEKPARHWVLVNSSGFEAFFEKCAMEFAKRGGPDMNRIATIASEHGIHFADSSKVPGFAAN